MKFEKIVLKLYHVYFNDELFKPFIELNYWSRLDNSKSPQYLNTSSLQQ